MATLADELENDFADSGSEEDQAESKSYDNDGRDGFTFPAINGARGDVNGDSIMEDEDEDGDEDDSMDTNEVEAFPGEAVEEAQHRRNADKKPSSMHAVKAFVTDMEPILERIAYFQALPPDQQTKNIGSVEDSPEYTLLTQSNSFSTTIDDYAVEVHKHIRDHYSVRFPELETLLPDPLQYAKTVAIISNGPFEKDGFQKLSTSPNNPVGKALNEVIGRHALNNIASEAALTKGLPLNEDAIQTVIEACKIMLRLEAAKKTLTEYVQSRMTLFAPNLTELIGSLTAAQLLNARGGLTALANTRASNIAAIGSKRATQAGLATNVGIRSQGYLYQSPTIARIRPELRVQAMRIVSAKIVLAARVDRVHESPDGATGEQLREECEKRLDKLTEPPPNKGVRALPAPDDKPSRKRGGRRARKAKEATAMTDIRKAQNRMAFGKEEQETGYGTGDGTKGLGMIGQSNEGRIRALQVDQRTRAKLSKKSLGWGGGASTSGAASTLRGFGHGGAGNASVLRGHGLRTSGLASTVGGGVAGTASSLVFTPKQGLELVDPKARAEAERKRKADEDRWFKGGTFTHVGGTSTSAAVATDAAGFKIPALPAARK